jgi:dipeptidase E
LFFDECVPRPDARAERRGELGPSSGSNRAWHILVGMARLLLASRGIPRLRELLQARGNQATLIPTASNPLADPTIADEVKDELAAAGLAVERIDLDEADAPGVRVALQSTDVLVVSGGDPFHLLQAARRISFADAAREALRAGAVYVGYSAGAMLAGPTLEPLRWTSPFPAPPALDLTGLGLADVLVLPHHDRAGRAERHNKAQMLFGDRVKLVPLRDGELVIQEGSRITVLHR